MSSWRRFGLLIDESRSRFVPAVGLAGKRLDIQLKARRVVKWAMRESTRFFVADLTSSG